MRVSQESQVYMEWVWTRWKSNSDSIDCFSFQMKHDEVCDT